ncbi:tyrosinase precursor [Fusarium sp. NRRL 52700]|nr:tyrosinase precursor [Fusarium sp. NRRL 52700]
MKTPRSKFIVDNGPVVDSNTADTTTSRLTDDKETGPLKPFHRQNSDLGKAIWTAYVLDGLSYAIHFFIGRLPCCPLLLLSTTSEFHSGGPGEDTTILEKRNYIRHAYSSGDRQSTSEGSFKNYNRQIQAQILSFSQVPLMIYLLPHDVSDYSIERYCEAEEYLRLHLWRRIVRYGGGGLTRDEASENNAPLISQNKSAV